MSAGTGFEWRIFWSCFQLLLGGAEAFLLVSLQESRAEGTSVVRCSGEIAFPAPAACLCPCDARWREAWCSVSKPGRRNNGSGLLGKCVRRGLWTGCPFVGCFFFLQGNAISVVSCDGCWWLFAKYWSCRQAVLSHQRSEKCPVHAVLSTSLPLRDV